ncbi:MAG TPA: hypothetical protein VN651_11035 [Gemmatimonadaceae bacterium]|nr:hypothetical protein [Gemmatimonadaceae bacterium]
MSLLSFTVTIAEPGPMSMSELPPVCMSFPDARGLVDESNLVVLDTAFAARMDSVFLDDLRFAREMTPAVLEAEPLWERVLERAAVLLSHLL